MWVLQIYVCLPQIPLLTAVLMFVIYKVLAGINEPSCFCWDTSLSPLLRRRCWEFGDLLRPLGVRDKAGIELAAFNAQPCKTGAAARLSGSACLNIASFHIIRMLPKFPSHRPLKLTQRLLISSTGSDSNPKSSLSAGVSNGLSRERMSNTFFYLFWLSVLLDVVRRAAVSRLL